MHAHMRSQATLIKKSILKFKHFSTNNIQSIFSNNKRIFVRIFFIIQLLWFFAFIEMGYGDWPTFHKDLVNSGYTISCAPDTNEVQWIFSTGGAIWSSPSIVGGKVYVGSGDGNLYCVDLYTGKEIWRYTTEGEVGSPSVVGGKIYVGSTDTRIYCLNLDTGKEVWQYKTGDAIACCPAVVEEKLYVGSRDGNIYCLNSNTGMKIWSYTTGGGVASSPAVADGKIYFGSEDNNIYCLDSNTGIKIWSYTTGGVVNSSPAVAEGKVYFGSRDNNVYCLDSNTGTLLWKYTTGDRVSSSPAVVKEKLYIGSWDGKIYCLNSNTGKRIWSYTTGNSVSSSPAVADGKVFVGSHDGNFYCLNMDSGAEMWRFTFPLGIYSSPAIYLGRVIISCFDGVLDCFGPQFSSVEPPDGLVGWWTGDVDANDIIGQNHGTLQNGAIIAPGLVDGAFSFDGVNDVVQCSASNINQLQQLTIEFWVKLNSLRPYSIQRFITLSNEKAVLRSDNGKLHFYMRINNELQHIWVENILQSGVYFHVAGTYDGKIMRLYLNGVEVGNLQVGGLVSDGDEVGLSNPGGETLDGLLDEVSIYNRALDALEIRAIYLSGSLGKIKPFQANITPIVNTNGPYSGRAGESITFSSTGTNDPDGTIMEYLWRFGDGYTSTSANPTHTYRSAGTYTVTLTVKDNSGASNMATTQCTVTAPTPTNQDPVAAINGPYSGKEDSSITFSSAGSRDPDGNVAEYSWDYGDGQTGSGANPSHIYEDAGTYTVTLRVTDNQGASDTATILCTVEAVLTPEEEEGGFPWLPVIVTLGVIAAVGGAFFLKKRQPVVKELKPVDFDIGIEPKEIPADGRTTSIITIGLLDEAKKPIEAKEEIMVTMSATGGVLVSASEVRKDKATGELMITESVRKAIEGLLSRREKAAMQVSIMKGEKGAEAAIVSSLEVGKVSLNVSSPGMRRRTVEMRFTEKRRYCMHCGAQISTRDRSCPKCSLSPPSGVDVMICPNCSSVLPSVAKFCADCGARQSIQE